MRINIEYDKEISKIMFELIKENGSKNEM